MLGVGSPLLDGLAQVDDEFLRKEVAGEKGGMVMIQSSERNRLLDLLSKSISWAPGGSAGNTVFALARMGIPAAMLGKVGIDKEGELYTNTFKQLGGSTLEFVTTSRHSTGICLSLVTPDAERTMRSDLGAAATLTAEDIQKTDFSRYSIVLIEGYMLFSAAFDAVIERAAAAGCKIAFDLASFEVVNIFRERLQDLLPKVSILFANADEARALCGDLPPETMLEQLASTCHTVALKLGKDGAIVRHGNETVRVSARLVENPVDTTAAGDLWAAGFLYGMAKRCPVQQAAEYGAVLSGEVVQVMGSVIPEQGWQRINQSLNFIQ